MRRNHNAHMLPPWKASRNNEQVAKLMPQDELFESEVAGAIRGRRYVFDPVHLRKLADSRPIDLPPGSVDVVHTFIDPSGGGQQSQLVCVSFAFVESEDEPHDPDDGDYPMSASSSSSSDTNAGGGMRAPRATTIVYLGMSRSANQTEVDERECVEAHSAALRALPSLHPRALLVNYVERNYGGGPGAGRILSYMQPFGRVHSFCERYNAPGVTTNHENKAEGVGMMIHELAAGNIRFARDMAFNTPEAGERKSIVDALLSQFSRFQKKLREKRDGTHTYFYTGKGGNNAPDDLAMSSCLLLWWAHEFNKRREYLLKSRGQSYE